MREFLVFLFINIKYQNLNIVSYCSVRSSPLWDLDQKPICIYGIKGQQLKNKQQRNTSVTFSNARVQHVGPINNVVFMVKRCIHVLLSRY